MIELEVGMRLKVRAGHWIRGNERGVIVEIYKDGRCLIHFDNQGHGFNNGMELVLDEKDFDILEK
jgi:hypothetical protein